MYNKNRACRKCGEYIPYRKKIDGKVRLLLSRKFCLVCSPYKGHNTKSDDPSRTSKSTSHYKFWSKERKLLHRARNIQKGIKRKEYLIKMLGGCCQICGYKKNIKCLCFHHKKPSEKIFELAAKHIATKKWDEVIIEAKKCQLLCLNCHGEVEDKRFLPSSGDMCDKIINTYKRKTRMLVEKKCQYIKCSKTFLTKEDSRRYCSSLCCCLDQRKVDRPSKEELEKLMLNNPMTKLGKIYGVSDNAVKKWAKRYGII